VNQFGPSTELSTPVLLRRIAQLEATVGRLSEDGLVVSGEQLAQAWGLTRQALAPAADRGEVFAVKVGNRLYYPQVFLTMDRESVASVCRALGGDSWL
jgi:hypothetical protein